MVSCRSASSMPTRKHILGPRAVACAAMSTDSDKQPKRKRLAAKVYNAELPKLQRELVKLQEWVAHEGLRVCVLFEGRDAAGKGGTIKRIVDRTNPRVVRVVALAKPTERERTQWYFQRYVAELPAGGEVVLFD